MFFIQNMQSIQELCGKEVVVYGQNNKEITGILQGLCLQGKTPGSIGKIYIRYAKRNGLPGSKGIDVFPGKTKIKLQS